ncbi:MAG: hypothetical protein AB2795_18110, partial [Candidatus Thiodiazotropha endolucinida]
LVQKRHQRHDGVGHSTHTARDGIGSLESEMSLFHRTMYLESILLSHIDFHYTIDKGESSTCES